MKKKISANLIFNLFVIVVSVALITYFCVSKDGLIDLLRSDIKINIFWIATAVLCQLGNMIIDSYLLYLYIKERYDNFSFAEGIKSSFIGSFFSAITPSASGGQPMQVVFLSMKKIDAGYSSSCLIQKFLVYQITSTFFTVIALILEFDFFIANVNTPILWLFLIAGFFSQVVVTGLIMIASFNSKISRWLIRLTEKLLKNIRWVKNPEKHVKKLDEQIQLFHTANKSLVKSPKLMVISFVMIFIQILLIMLIPYCVYRGFSLDSATVVEIVCSQSFVTLASSMMPLPGATGAAELAFSVFYGMFFGTALLKSALLMWRIITYYAVILLCAPFSMLTKKKSTDNTNKAIK
ncbi:MAG: lysylphosphatidylglycerol synthase transmembrane domain-containing protein [Acutalibacteraceae bacterium]|nr:lysylphosphatidylglycerol synthase transmembrane domain-containing protein [Acutalibacteraceae bacterium]